jgi:UV excision repair protein RAD23
LNESVEGGEQLGEAIGGEEGGQPAHEAGHLTIAVTEADRDALQRLQAMGFPEQLVIEAYFACERDEALAVNYILGRMEEAQNEGD